MILGTVKNIDTDTVISDNYTIYLVNADFGNINITLLPADVDGLVIVFSRTDVSNNTVTLQGTGGSLIDGSATQNLITFNMAQYASFQNNWYTIEGNIFTPNAGQNYYILFTSGKDTVPSSGEVFIAQCGITPIASGSQIISPRAGSITSMRVATNTSPGGTRNFHLYIQSPGGSNNLVYTLSISGSQFSTNSGTISIPVGLNDLISISTDTSGSVPSVPVYATLILT